MTRPIDNQHVIEIKLLPSPRDVKTKLPIGDEVSELVFRRDRRSGTSCMAAIMTG